MKRYVIVGAGSAGLTLAYYLCKSGLPVTVLECEKEVGGLARSFHYDDWHFDIGPHRFYTANAQVMNFLQEVQPRDFIEIPRFSSVYFMGHYHAWPLRLSTVFKLPFSVAVRAGIDLIRKAKLGNSDSVSFRDYVLRRYGKTLYETFFRDYTEKFVGIATQDTHRNWAKVGVERATIDNTVNTASLLEIFKLMLLPKPAELNFWYPLDGGIHTFWQNCAAKIRELGGEIITGVSPRQIDVTNDTVTRITFGPSLPASANSTPPTGAGDAEQSVECERLIWSGPITEITSKLNLPATELTYRSHLVYNIMLNCKPRYDFQWCYYGAKKYVFSRLCNPAAFSEHTVPKGHGGLCAEVACQLGDDNWNDPERLRKDIIQNLLDVRILESERDIDKIAIERVPNAYPIYHIHYPEWLDQATERLNKFSNLNLLGRTGRFWYNNMDHSIENAFAVALELLENSHISTPAVAKVKEELRPAEDPT